MRSYCPWSGQRVQNGRSCKLARAFKNALKLFICVREYMRRSSNMSNAKNTNGHAIEASTVNAVIRQHAEQQFAEELAELKRVDERQRPPNWVLSPWAVRTYVLGGKLENGFAITPQYIGNTRLVD